MANICYEERFIIDLLFNDKIFTENDFKALDYSKLTKITSSFLLIPALYINIKKKKYKNYTPEDFYKYIEQIYEINLERNKILYKEVKLLSKELNKKNINHVFLKGASYLFSNIFWDIGERMVGDIDFLISKSDISETEKILDEIGYNKFSEYSFFEFKHLTRRTKKEMIFAIEPHFNLLEYESKLIFTDDVLSMKIEKGEVFVPDFNTQLNYCVLNNQINDYGYKYLNVDYRFIYDLHKIYNKLSGKVSWNKNKYYRNCFMIMNELGINNLFKDNQKNHIKFNRLRLQLKRKYKIYNFLDFYLVKFLTKLNRLPLQIREFFINKDYRKYIRKKYSTNF
ncbi:MAG: hypothetical protein CMK44_00470 [Porticoccus sp.]|nr:hypothetical protein [Porticoccus sp.]